MTQLAWDFDLLDDSKQPEIPAEMYSCGAHRQRADVIAHWEECLKLTCARCGEVSVSGWAAENNHGSIEWRAFCHAQISYLNHAARCRLILDGDWKHEPQTNCFVAEHKHADPVGYFRKGAPIACIQAEFDQRFAWLVSHNIDPDCIGSLGVWNANKDAVSA